MLVFSQAFEMSSETKYKYDQVLNLSYVVENDLTSGKNLSDLYVQVLGETITVLLSEDPQLFKEYEARIDNRIDFLEKSESASSLFLIAEIRLQWAFVYLKFGKEFDAAWNLRQAYQIAIQCKKKYPSFVPILKTSGVLNIMIGSVPEKYDWLLSILGMEGNVLTGMNELNQIQESNTPFAIEANLISSMIEGFIFQKPDAGIKHISDLLEKEQPQAAVLLLATTLSIKNSESENALVFINSLQSRNLNLPFIQYLKGEIYLQKGLYVEGIAAFKKFIDTYPGENHRKDAYYKTALCYWLVNDEAKAKQFYNTGKNTGREETEADKYAARSLDKNTFPNKTLTKLRYFTDGGYYDQATTIIQATSESDFKTQQDITEFHYRKARLYHKTNNLNSAIIFYKKSIEENENLADYFAPNACLQLGYIYGARKDYTQAELYFKKALSYKKHEYKNSIDSKARSALSQLKERK